MLDERHLIAKAIRATEKIEGLLNDRTSDSVPASDLAWIRMQLALDARRFVSVPNPPPVTKHMTDLMSQEFELGERPPELADWLEFHHASEADELRSLADALDAAADSEAGNP